MQKQMSVREYNEMLKKERQSKIDESLMNAEITIYNEEEFNNRTIEHWDEFEGLCREPTNEEIEAWRIRNNI